MVFLVAFLQLFFNEIPGSPPTPSLGNVRKTNLGTKIETKSSSLRTVFAQILKNMEKNRLN